MIYNIYNEFHLGDNVYQMHWNKKIIDNYPEAIINYYCHDKYIGDLLILTEDKYGSLTFTIKSTFPPLILYPMVCITGELTSA